MLASDLFTWAVALPVLVSAFLAAVACCAAVVVDLCRLSSAFLRRDAATMGVPRRFGWSLLYLFAYSGFHFFLNGLATN